MTAAANRDDRGQVSAFVAVMAAAFIVCLGLVYEGGEHGRGHKRPAGERIRTAMQPTAGRWPANIVLTDPIFDGGWEGVVGGGTVDAGGYRPPSSRARNNGIGLFGVGPLSTNGQGATIHDRAPCLISPPDVRATHLAICCSNRLTSSPFGTRPMIWSTTSPPR